MQWSVPICFLSSTFPNPQNLNVKKSYKNLSLSIYIYTKPFLPIQNAIIHIRKSTLANYQSCSSIHHFTINNTDKNRAMHIMKLQFTSRSNVQIHDGQISINDHGRQNKPTTTKQQTPHIHSMNISLEMQVKGSTLCKPVGKGSTCGCSLHKPTTKNTH